MSDSTKLQLISAFNTFAATFIITIGMGLQGGIEWNSAFWISIATAGGRAAIKAVLNQFLPTKLGGVKK